MTSEIFITQFFHYLSDLGNQTKADPISLQKYMSQDCVIKSNGEVVCQGITSILRYTEEMQEKYEQVRYVGFLENLIFSDEKVVIPFQVECVAKTGIKTVLETIAIVTIHNGKINHWEEVYHEIAR